MKLLLLFFLFSTIIFAQDSNNDWKTYYEKSGFKETPHYAETIEYCKRLADASPMITYTTFGVSPQGRDLPLLIIDKNGNSTAEQVRRTNNVVFLIQAGIHSGEIDGKDAGFMLIRDMIIEGKNKDLLDHVTILFMPIFSVDGHERFGAYNRINQNGPEEMGWRVTAQNYNLNRDYLKADAPEMQSWLKLYNTWLPEFFADCHVTDGADYQYAVTYSIEFKHAHHKMVGDWVKNGYLDSVMPAMEKSGFPMIKYVWFKKVHDPKSGIGLGIAGPRYSNGYTILHNRPGLLIETHMFKDYKTRVDGTYQLLKHSLQILNRDYLKLRDAIAQADAKTRKDEFRKKTYPLKYKQMEDSVLIDFLGYEYTIEKSDLSGGDWQRFSKDSVTMKIPLFNNYQPDITAQLPEAYIVPVEWTKVIDRIKLHGIRFETLNEEHKIKVSSFKFSNEKWSERPYENHHTLTFDVEKIEEERLYPKGSIVIPMNQRTAKVIAHILEPKGPDSFLFWGFFDSVFEQKEYAESYVMEEYARIMLANDENLKNKFEQKLKEDKVFAADPSKILKWFYRQSPYWDKRINKYPVGKIFDKEVLKRIVN
ncbi:MAG: peptidase M14 [Calditrichaeota bacterium]|nr:MAG: peptidase M14 [Calditrichota bacterium]MBL1204789.1 peptidase M14 [Calditrichota bacterium]NOG44618.1 M14 family metallopeptidase [Calditrichota bacterium]